MKTVSTLKISKILLSEVEVSNQICEVFKEKTSFKNVAAFYEITATFSLKNLSKALLCYIERFFTVVAETENFQQLSSALVAKVLSSSSLHVTSELEVVNAANGWLSRDFEGRRAFASDLFAKVRLSLLSSGSLERLLRESSAFAGNDERAAILQNVVDSKKVESKLSARHRYCGQDMFDVLVCGGYFEKCFFTNVHKVDGRSFKPSKADTLQMKRTRAHFKAVYLRGEVYFLYGFNRFRTVKQVDKYSVLTQTWQRVSQEDVKQENFCACALMDKIYICGGERRDKRNNAYVHNPSDTERMFDTKDCSFKPIAEMMLRRNNAACSAYRGKVVVSGGTVDGAHSRAVEAYDHETNEWAQMPSMLGAREYHGQVAVRNKLFIIARPAFYPSRESCEVFDSDCQQFALIKRPVRRDQKSSRFRVVSIGEKIVAYSAFSRSYWCYDIGKDQWCEEDFELTENIIGFCCVKVPKLIIY